MKILFLVGLIIITGCGTSLNELRRQRSECLGAVQVDGSAGCPDELHEEIDRREARILRRKEIKAAWDEITYCRNGYFFCDDFWCQQSRQRQMPKRSGFSSGCSVGPLYSR